MSQKDTLRWIFSPLFFVPGSDRYSGVSMRFILILLVGVFQLPMAQAGDPVTKAFTVEHHFKAGETLWFVSLLYYGKGGQFNKIVEANHLSSTEGIKDGQVLKIPDTNWKPDSADYKAHYEIVWKKHQAKIQASKGTKSDDVTVVVIQKDKVKAESMKASSNRAEAKLLQVSAQAPSQVLVVPIPSSPIFPAGEVPSPAALPAERSATEGTSH